MPDQTVENITAEVDVDAAKAIAELEAFKAAVKDATSVDGTAQIKTDFDRGGANKALFQINQNIGKISASAKQAASLLPDLGDGILNVGVEAKEATKGTDGLSKSTKSLVKELAGLKIGLGGLKLGAIALLVGPAVSGINALAGATVALTAALAPLTGLVAVIPQGIAAIGQGGLVAVAGLGGLKKALEDISKAKSFEEQEAALNRLNPALRETADLVRGALGFAWKNIQRTAQTALLPGLNEGLKAAMPLLTAIQPLLAATGNVLGQFGSKLGALLGSEGFGDKFTQIGMSNVKILNSFGDAILSVTKGIQDLMIAAAPMTEALARGIASASAAFSDWANEGSSSGRLQSFFQETLRVASQLKTIFGDLGGALGNIGAAAAPLGRDILNAFERIAQSARDWTGEAQNAAGMTDWFNSLKEPLRELAGLVGDVVRTFIEMQDNGTFTNIIQNVRDLIPVFQAVLEAAGKVLGLLSELSTVWTPLAAAATVVGEFASALSGLLDMAPALKGLITAFVLLKTTVTAINFVNLMSGLAGLVRGTAAAKAGAMGQAGAMNILKSSAGGAAVAVTGLVTAYQMYNSVMSEAKAAGESVTNGLRDQMMNVDASKISLEDLNNITATYSGEIEGLKGKLAGSSSPFDHDARAGWRAQIESSEQLNGELKALIPAVEQLAEATGMTTQAASAFAVSQWQAGNAISAGIPLLRGYSKILGTDVLAAYSAMMDAQREAATLLKSAQAADNDVAAANENLSRTIKNATVDTITLRNAQESAAEAAKALADSYYEAAERLEDLRFAQRRSVLSEARAINSLQDAYDRLRKLQQGVGKATKTVTQVTDDFTGKIFEVTRLTGEASDAAEDQAEREKALRDALLDIMEAQLAVEEAKDATKDATRELAIAESKGIEQSDLVVAAKKRLRDANEAVTAAIKAQKKAAEDNAYAIKQAQGEVDAAVARSKVAWKTYHDYVVGPLLVAEKTYNDGKARQLMLMTAIRQELEKKIWLEKFFYGSGGRPGENGVLAGEAAHGGYVGANKTFLVGERGPELFMPSRGGTIVPATNTDAVIRSLGSTSGSKDGMSAQQIESIVSAVVGRVQKPNIEQHFHEKADPLRMGAELAWRMQ